MIVIFKIIMDFDDLVGIINKFQNSFDVLFVNGQMFIFAKNLKKYTVNKIKKILTIILLVFDFFSNQQLRILPIKVGCIVFSKTVQ